MDFTREPIIETVITPKEGCKLVVRSSKSTGQEEYFVDAVEVVSFGHSFFFRSLERPKMFLVPVTDYEILEVREARMVLKNVGLDRTIKIGGGRDNQMRAPRESQQEKAEQPSEEAVTAAEPSEASADKAEGRSEKKRDRRRQSRRRRGRDGAEEETETSDKAKQESTPVAPIAEGDSALTQQVVTTSILTSLLPPPPTLISETIARYKDNVLFKDAFYSKEEKEGEHILPTVPLEQPEYGSFEVSEEEEERIYQQRKQSTHGFSEDIPSQEGDREPSHNAMPSNDNSKGEETPQF